MQLDPRFLSDLSPDLCARLINGNPPRIDASGAVHTGAVRLSWPSLDEPKAPKPGNVGVAKYQVSGLFPHKNVGVIVAALDAKIRESYPSVSDPSVFRDPGNKNHPLKDQGLKVSLADGGKDPVGKGFGGYVPGFPFFTAKSTRAVPVFRHLGGRPVALVPGEIEATVYAGCWVTVKLVILKSTAAGNPGVYFGLQSLMKLADDRKFLGGGSDASPADFADAFTIEDPNVNQILQSATAAQDEEWG